MKRCEICGKAYEYCPICPRDMYKPRWMQRFDDERCKKLWDTLSANGIGDIDATEALNRLNEIDYKKISVQSAALREHIAKIEVLAATEYDLEFMNPPVDGTQDNGAIETDTNADINNTETEASEEAFEKPKKKKGFRH